MKTRLSLSSRRVVRWQNSSVLLFFLLVAWIPSGGLAQNGTKAAGVHRGINVVEQGADPTGNVDCTALLQKIHASKQRVYYPNGIYRFNGETLDFSGGIEFESRERVVIRNDISPASIIQFDDKANFIGLQQNHLEQDDVLLGPKGVMRSGSLMRPPLSAGSPSVAVDFIAHWYNDGGLDCRRLGGGWNGWYYWSWNFHTTRTPGKGPGDGYDPARHPLLGFYRGDDPVVLDWQCYWLAEYGVKAVTLWSGAARFDQWEQPGREDHWIYQLFNNVPNFQKLNYILWAPSPWKPCTPENQATIEETWEQVIDRIYLRYKNFYYITSEGKAYPVICVFEGEALRGIFDNYLGAQKTSAFLVRMAKRFKTAGYGGLALFVRNPTSDKMINYADLERQGVLYFKASYSESYGKGGTYSERFATATLPADSRSIVNTATALHSHTPHPSKWVCPGHTPVLFGEQLKKAVDHVRKNGMLRIVTCYNVAEWAEGGPGLQPNMQDRSGYLQSVKSAVVLPPGTAPQKNNVFLPKKSPAPRLAK